MGSHTSTATVVEAPPAKADFKSIRQNGTDGDAATWNGYCQRLEGRWKIDLGLCHSQIGLFAAPSSSSNKSNL